MLNHTNMIVANIILTLALVVACAWIIALLPPEKKPAPNPPPPPPRIPCSIKAAKEYAGQLRQIAVQESWKADNGPKETAQRSLWLAAKANYALFKVREEKAYEDANNRNLVEDTYVMVMRGRHQNDQGTKDMSEEGGSRLRAYRSPVDGTIQTYSVNIPGIYDPAVKWPLVVSMHGHGWYGLFQGHPAPGYGGVICVSPQGRGSSDYKDLGEDDVLTVIAEVKREFNIDPDRVYLTGGSMGGTGAFHIGVHYADQFAGIFPIVGNADNEAWTERWGWNRVFEGRNNELRKQIQEGHTARAFAVNLRNLPAYIVSGSADTIVPPAHSRNTVAELRAMGYNVEYREYPGIGHGGFSWEMQQAGMAWMCGWKRNPFPRRVTWKAGLLKHGHAYWVRLDQLDAPLQFGEIDAEALDDHTLDVQTKNLRAFSIQRPAALFDSSRELSVCIDGVTLTLPASTLPGDEQWHGFARHPGTGAWMLASDVERPALRQCAGTEGPINEALMAPFVLVVGTTNEAMNEIWLTEARRFAEDWKRRYADYPRMIFDKDLTEDMEQEYNLILFGGSSDNSVSALLVPLTPLKELQELLQFNLEGDDKKTLFERPDVGSMLVYPNMNHAPNRLAVIIHANGPEAAYQVWGRFGNWFNWGVFDSKKYFDFAIYDNLSSSPETMLLVGWFGTEWDVKHSVYYFGENGVRKASAPQHYPLYGSVPAGLKELSLTELRPAKIDQMRGALGFNRTFFGEPLGKGIGMRAPAVMEYDIDGKFMKFVTDVALLNPRESNMCKTRKDGESMRFTVFGDGRKLGEVKIDWKKPKDHLEVDVSQVKKLKLEAAPAGGPAWLHMGSAWLSPTLK